MSLKQYNKCSQKQDIKSRLRLAMYVTREVVSQLSINNVAIAQLRITDVYGQTKTGHAIHLPSRLMTEIHVTSIQ